MVLVNTLLVLLGTTGGTATGAPPIQHETVIVPTIDGAGWRIASTPDLGELNSPGQQPVDFTIWRAADGSWQLWSCIRGTACGGQTRLFYRWEAAHLTETDWQPMGIAMQGDTTLGETAGGLQAPHVVRVGNEFRMAYGDWENICFARSVDGKSFEKIVQPDGRTAAFGEGAGANTRDPMLVRIDGLWHCYYTALPRHQGYIFCRTSEDLARWSPAFIVNYGGRIGNMPWWAECPFVVEPAPGEFVLFRNQYYGENATNWVYHSKNPRDFGIDHDAKRCARLDFAAPEIIRDGDAWYMAHLAPTLDGIRIAPFRWARRPWLGEPVFPMHAPEDAAYWSVVQNHFDQWYTNRKTDLFEPYTGYFISTGGTAAGDWDDQQTGTIESSWFEITSPEYELLISGGSESESTYVAVEVEGQGEVLRFAGRNSLALDKEFWRAGGLAGQRARLRIVDTARGPWGHISFGGLFAVPSPTPLD